MSALAHATISRLSRSTERRVLQDVAGGSIVADGGRETKITVSIREALGSAPPPGALALQRLLEIRRADGSAAGLLCVSSMEEFLHSRGPQSFFDEPALSIEIDGYLVDETAPLLSVGQGVSLTAREERASVDPARRSAAAAGRTPPDFGVSLARFGGLADERMGDE